MKQTGSLFRNISLFILSFSFFLASCSKDKDMANPQASYAGQYEVMDDNETYILQIANKGGNNFEIKEFGGFLNASLKAVAEGNILKIPSQTFTNPNGSTITITGTGVLSTKNLKDDTISFQYSVKGFTDYEGDFTGTRK